MQFTRQQLVDLAESVDALDLKKKVKMYSTAYTKAAETGRHQLVTAGVKVPWVMFSEGDTSQFFNWFTDLQLGAAEKLLKSQPELVHLPSCISAVAHNGDVTNLDYTITVVNTAVLAAQVPWLPVDTTELQSVRAANNHYGDSWFDHVVVRNGDGGEWVGQLRLLFHIRVQNEGGVAYKQFAFVRWLCVPYHYQVIDLDTIIRSAYVVKDYKLWKDDDERFFLSAFKWQRAQPDLRKCMDIDSESGSESEE